RALALPGGLRPDLAARERAVTLHVEDPDVLAGGVVDEEPAAVEREAEPVGPVEVVADQDRAPRIRDHPEHALERQLLRPRDAVEFGPAVRRIAEEDGAVGPADDVVRTVELLALLVGG